MNDLDRTTDSDFDRVVLDTSALYATISQKDDFHLQATEHWTRLIKSTAELWVSSYVLVELGALVHSRLGFAALKSFLDLTRNAYETFWIGADLHEIAWAALESRDGKGLDFVDWTTLLTARALNATIFTFDDDFRGEGVPLIPGTGS